MSRKSKHPIHSLKGFRDVLPDDQKYWDLIYDKARQIASDYGFKKLDTPIVEDARLYMKATGQFTDIVQKELYVFEDKGGEKVALRPEFTPGILRSYLEHGMINQPQPVKLFSYGPVFRHDKPQAGRYRQFNQFNFEVVGSAEAEVDARFIAMVKALYFSFGLEVVIEINSIGCPDCREKYVKKLVKSLKDQEKKLCENCKERIHKNPLRVLDCKEKHCQTLTENAPQIIDNLCEDCKNHFVKVLEHLDAAEVVYSLNPRLVRGLDYYTRTTFEVYLSEEVAKLAPEDARVALGGGGRYDGLMEILGGRKTPALGMAGGVERVINVLRRLKVYVPDPEQADVFIAQLGEEAKKKCQKLFDEMRKQNIRVREAFAKNSLKGQLEIADKLKVKFALILGQKEIMDGTIIIRDMSSGIQEIVVFDNIIDEIKKRLLGSSDMKVYVDRASIGPSTSENFNAPTEPKKHHHKKHRKGASEPADNFSEDKDFALPATDDDDFMGGGEVVSLEDAKEEEDLTGEGEQW
ncbi:MAG: histidine--tRNA ligase [Patescibacteria group bacterium]|nr:histidine--tRNA ligase [Patescibacteria group bacterium]